MRIHVEIQEKYLNWGWNEREVSPKHVNIFIQQRKTSNHLWDFFTLLGPFICHQIVFWTFWGKHKRNFQAEISPGIPQEKEAVMSNTKKSPSFPLNFHREIMHCISLGVTAGILMPIHSLLLIWPIKVCCLFIVCRHHWCEMHHRTFYIIMIRWITMQVAYTI